MIKKIDVISYLKFELDSFVLTISIAYYPAPRNKIKFNAKQALR